ncbi:Type II secretion system (T2SS), protein F [Candidatus Tiddalikarchaeum anstoanum]|nr:Type II secretion system (T2SS), protein F [Candidatus Tiddalikarchaeum anstoanum]
MKTIFENKRLDAIASILKPFANILLITNPNLKVELEQAGLKVKPASFASISLLLSLIYSILLSLVIYGIFYYFDVLDKNKIIIILSLGFLFFTFLSVYNMNYPKLILAKRVNELDRSLLFALRHILIKVRSGIPFFDSIAGVAYNDYGYISLEFRKAIKDIEGGSSEVQALENIEFYNPSPFFRKFIWQITNSIRAGTDIAKTLEVIVTGIENDRYVQIKTFANRLSPIALMYVMFTIILPALSITFITIFSFFFGSSINAQIFYIIPLVLLVFNIFFLNIIKSTMPTFEME